MRGRVLPEVNLKDTFVQVRPKSLEGLMAAMSKPGVHHIDLKGAALKLGQRLQEQGPTESLVLRAWTAGCTVTGGVLHLPQSAVLLLTGSGACFKGTSFIGVPPMHQLALSICYRAAICGLQQYSVGAAHFWVSCLPIMMSA